MGKSKAVTTSSVTPQKTKTAVVKESPEDQAAWKRKVERLMCKQVYGRLDNLTIATKLCDGILIRTCVENKIKDVANAQPSTGFIGVVESWTGSNHVPGLLEGFCDFLKQAAEDLDTGKCRRSVGEAS